jgi:hypothetical protein
MGFTGSHTFTTDYLDYCNGSIVKCLISGKVVFNDGTIQFVNKVVPPYSITPLSTRADGYTQYECVIDFNHGIGPYAVSHDSGFINLDTTKAIKEIDLLCEWIGTV